MLVACEIWPALQDVAPHSELLWNYFCFKSGNRSRQCTIIQPDILEIHNFVENNCQHNKLLEKHKASIQLLETNVCKHILMAVI